MPLNNFETTLILTCSSACVITNSTVAERFAITDRKLYVFFRSNFINMVLKEQLTGININHNQKQWLKVIFKLLNWSMFSKSK